MPRTPGERRRRKLERGRRRGCEYHWREVYARDDGRCRYCGDPVVFVRQIPAKHRSYLSWGVIEYHPAGDASRTVRMKAATLDHITSIGNGGTNDYDNLALACVDCNAGKCVAEDVDRAGPADRLDEWVDRRGRPVLNPARGLSGIRDEL
jgi:hypothetical protein